MHVWLVANPNPPGEVLSTQLSLQYESADFGVSASAIALACPTPFSS